MSHLQKVKVSSYKIDVLSRNAPVYPTPSPSITPSISITPTPTPTPTPSH